MPTGLAKKITDTEAHLLHAEIDSMHGFADYLEQPCVEVKDDGAFALIIQLAVDKYHVDTDALATRFGVNRTTIGRWKSGKNAPQPMARPFIVSWICEQVRAEIKVLKAKLQAQRGRVMA